jgi:hypothetical protein
MSQSSRIRLTNLTIRIRFLESHFSGADPEPKHSQKQIPGTPFDFMLSG